MSSGFAWASANITLLYLDILGSPNYKILITGAALDEENTSGVGHKKLSEAERHLAVSSEAKLINSRQILLTCVKR